MGSSILGSLTQVLKGKISALVLGPAGVGVVNQLTLCFSLFLTASSLGVPNGIARNIAVHQREEDEEAIRAQLSSSFIFLAAVSLGFSGLGMLLSPLISDMLFDDGGGRANLVVLVLLGVPVGVAGLVYRSLLNGTRSVKQLTFARMAADVLSVAVFAALVVPFGIPGAALGLVSLHLLYLVLISWGARVAIGALSRPRLAAFRWQAVRMNMGFGIHGLVIAVLTIFSTLLVSRWIITDFGIAESGLFSVALKVTSVYLGGLYAAASGYYFASIARAQTPEELADQIDKAIALYMVIVPPIIVGLMAGGDLIVRILFSAEFLPVATILLVLLPGDVLRLVAETIGQAILARKHFVLSAGIMLAWTVCYMVLVKILMARYGLIGIALAYLVSHAGLMVAFLVAGRIVLGYLPRISSTLFAIRGFALVGVTAFAVYGVDYWPIKIAIGVVALAGWAVVSSFDPQFAAHARKSIDIVLRRRK
ncbi:oligosaccharide flippase family protein [Arenimonas sp.]|uniref:oligosaccharide flippase family protein n=1 Tax=Arenimonas sp. TaxID=1872635 RepID=UPI002D7FF0CE|nr:oligosaccharide flippase family protein [Arenimonas sp.]